MRYYKYWSNSFANSDELILPVLELLYVNRFEINEFTLAAVASTLKLISSCSHILSYIMQIPAPLPYVYYTDWVSVLLKNGLKAEPGSGKRNILN
jgi:hypothetical protein